MKKRLLLLFFLTAAVQFSFAQTTGIKGRLVDSADNKSLDNSVVALLKRDSTLVGFTRANAAGNFEFQIPPDSVQDYILMVTHPSFADFLDSINLKSGELRNLGLVHMLSKVKLLEEVIVRGNRSMFMRGDTTIFTADSFKVAEGANVEELLKKLPGLQVDRNGQITAMGETVKKVLVDGEEFFGSDPGIATKNLQANAVQEVQVYDRKSDQANFTGIDDGTRDKTLNLKLKEDKKKGYFGKIDAGGGIMEGAETAKDKGRYYGAAMLNAFKGKRKIAAYGITSNTGFMNLDWDDNDKFGGGNNMEMVGDGIFISSGGWNSSTGIPINYNGGLHYSNKFNEDKNSLNTGYKFVQIDAPGNTKRFSKNFADATAPWSTNYENNFVNSSKKHALNGTFESKLDSMNTLKLTAGANMNISDNQSASHSESIDDGTGNFLNKNQANNRSRIDQTAYNANLLWMHKFKKEFRSLSINAGINTSESKGNALVYSKTDFFNTVIGDSSVTIDQNNLVNNNNNSVNSKISYTEPLAKDFYMETSYSFATNKRQNNRDIFAKGAGGNYDDKIDSLSNDYEFNDMSNSPGLSFRLTRKKLNASVGTVVGFTKYSQLNKSTGAGNDFNFTNHFPRANVSYQIKPSERLWFSYNGNTSAPSLEQMQPIRNNTDQLNQYIGNPDLRPSFRHNFNTNYSSWKMLNQRSIWVSLNAAFTQNSFSSLSYVRNGARTTQTVNTNGVFNINAYGSYNRLVSKKLNLSLGVSPQFSLSNGIDFIALNNGPVTKNTTRNENYSMRLRIATNKEKKYDISLSPNISYNIAKGSISNFANANYWAWGGDLWSTIYLPKNFELQNNLDAEFRQADERFPTNNNFVFWDAELRKWLYKKELQLKFAAKDILNQRNGYSRNFGSSSFTETYNTILKRHFLLGLVWNFNKMGAGDAPTAK